MSSIFLLRNRCSPLRHKLILIHKYQPESLDRRWFSVLLQFQFLIGLCRLLVPYFFIFLHRMPMRTFLYFLSSKLVRWRVLATNVPSVQFCL